MLLDISLRESSQLLGDKEVACIAVVNFFRLTGFSYVWNIFKENDFHGVLTSGDF
jgi:hypothetical protein